MLKKHVDKIKNSALSTDTDLVTLYDMTSKERRDYFTKETDAETGKFLNTKFEQAMVSKQTDAMLDWAKSVFSPEEKKKAVYKNVIDKINNLSELGYMTGKQEDVFLEDLVTDKLGISVSREEMENIVKRAEEIQKQQEKLGDNLNNPEFYDENINFYKSIKGMNDYLQSRAPAKNSAILMGTIGRGMMLFSVKSPLLNIGSNMEVGLTEAITRRIANGTVKGANNQLALDYMKMARDIYKKTGFDISRMQGMQDLGASGERVLGDTVHTQGEGKIRAVGRVVEDIVFKKLLGAPDAFFASAHFADSVNLQSMELAKGDKKLASKYMVDAMRVSPVSDQGKLLRAQAMLDAQVATWTNDTWASKATVEIRRVFNDMNQDLRIGDYLFPFVKTPANVIATGLDYSGLGAVKGIYKLVQMVKKRDFNKQAVQSIVRDLTRAGLGVTAALALAANTDDDDFMGAYDPKRAQIESLRGARENSFRVGNTWISTDWLGPLSVPYNAIMYSRKYGKEGTAETAFQYGKGVASTLLNLPVVSDVMDFYKSESQKQDMSLGEMIGSTGDYAMSQAMSRLVPSIFSDIAKATDPSERKTTNAVEAIQAKVPGLRHLLEKKRNVFGEDMQAENPVFSMLFGSRVKGSKETPLIKELSDVSAESGKSMNFTDWTKSASKKLSQFHEKVGDGKYREATIEYGKTLKDLIQKTISSSSYKKLSAEEKAAELNNLDVEAQEKVFAKYGFKYKIDKKK